MTTLRFKRNMRRLRLLLIKSRASREESKANLRRWKIKGHAVVFGVNPRFVGKPIVNLPQGAIKVRTRFRIGQTAKCYVRMPEGVYSYILGPSTGKFDAPAMRLEIATGVNRKA